MTGKMWRVEGPEWLLVTKTMGGMTRIKVRSIDSYHDVHSEMGTWTQIVLQSGVTIAVSDSVEEIDSVILGVDPPRRDDKSPQGSG